MSVDLPVYFITIDSSSWRAKRPSSTLNNGTTPSRSLRKNMVINSTTEKIPLARMVPAGFKYWSIDADARESTSFEMHYAVLIDKH